MPDPERVAGISADRSMAFGPGPKIGICWRSMMLGAKRAKYYSALDAWGPILKAPGVTFVNLQYGDCADELARARGAPRRRHQGRSTVSTSRTTSTARRRCRRRSISSSPRRPRPRRPPRASGTEVWFLTAGRTWPQLGTDEYPWYRKTQVFSPAEIRRLERTDAARGPRAGSLREALSPKRADSNSLCPKWADSNSLCPKRANSNSMRPKRARADSLPTGKRTAISKKARQKTMRKSPIP